MRRWFVLALSWLAVAVPAAAVLWLHTPTQTVIAGHDVAVRPTLNGWATLNFGPYLPDFRYPTGVGVGANIEVGKTNVTDYDTLIERYAAIAAAPDGEVARLRKSLEDSAVDALVTGAALGLVGPLVVVLVGWSRWNELFHQLTTRRTEIGVIAIVLTGYVGYYSFVDRPGPQVTERRWEPLASVLTDVTLPDQATKLQIDRGLFTTGTAALVNSVVSSWKSSQTFYDDLAEMVDDIGPQLRQPVGNEVIGMLVSDRHDNINMDEVARALYKTSKASFLMDGGDDTSSGSSWESFSLESLGQTFDDVKDKYGVAGNHDEGDFVVKTLQHLDFKMMLGEPVDGPSGVRFLGASDPRSSGLGSWLTEKNVTMEEQTKLLADRACKEDADGHRITTMLVHDATVGREALARGCVDLVLAGHRHEQVGPSQVVGTNGRFGYEYTTGTTGGAAYAIALGSKLRRNAMISLVTYLDGRPVGIQPVTFRTVKDIVVSPYLPLLLN